MLEKLYITVLLCLINTAFVFFFETEVDVRQNVCPSVFHTM